ncbi:hypothetical protein BOSEA31B_13803 [Hyphomicrobiales bacterium]|nr:hypothetical protein BOSEA31B_13803 [Hyphomicrobiales bacterium]CAH1699573.1 hypothetical protein BOSEA1005_12626 [Hyphomicrobiales bacterium]CAI0344580.1 hypothetical protein BO1005MUT1_330247 [Hyphomicrobiales bacterium]
MLDLSCTTSIATNAARAVLTHVRDGALYRFSTPEGGSGVRYRLCTRVVLNEPRAEFRAAAPPRYYHLI